MSQTPNTVTVASPAKLNLFLHITGKRPDGYHELQTAFQLLDLEDELEFSLRSDGKINIDVQMIDVDSDAETTCAELSGDDNLVLRAARLLRSEFSAGAGADIALRKRLPMGGGLGGGSSNAASTLLALNALWGLEADVDRLAALGLRLGADVPLFVRGSSAWAAGIGEQLEALSLPNRWFVVIHPNCHVSTKEIFLHPELTRDTPAITIAAFFAGASRNDCEKLVRRLARPVDKALIWLQNFGEARMTGTGACVFASFDSEARAQAVRSQVPKEWLSFVAQGINRSPVMEQLKEQLAS